MTAQTHGILLRQKTSLRLPVDHLANAPREQPLRKGLLKEDPARFKDAFVAMILSVYPDMNIVLTPGRLYFDNRALSPLTALSGEG